MEYVGDFKDGKKDGEGKILFKGGDEGVSSYEGAWENDEFHGKGKYVWNDGERTYEGQWVQGIMEGKGKMTYRDGSYYEGTF